MTEIAAAIDKNLNSTLATFSSIFAYVMRIIVACLCLENCRLCKRELSLSLAYDYSQSSHFDQHLDYLPTTRFERAAHTISKIVCTESTYPAKFKDAKSSFGGNKYSHCLCCDCWLALEIGEPLIGSCKLKGATQERLPIFSGAAYENKVRDLIGGLKYDGDRLLVTDLCYIMLNVWGALMESVAASNLVFVPVPLHKHRLRNRGFNQAELLTKNLSQVTGIERANALYRTVHTKPQQTLGRHERLKNVKGAFKVNARMVRGKNVILVDDVCTSGATLIECAEELLKEGAASVVAVTVARAIFWESQQEKDAA